MYEAARLDGAGPVRTYLAVTLPLLRPVTAGRRDHQRHQRVQLVPGHLGDDPRRPGFSTDTTTTYMYKLAFDNQDVGESAAMAVVNFALILLVVLVYLRVVRREETG